MLTPSSESILPNSLWLVLPASILWATRIWYFRLVSNAGRRVCDLNGNYVPGQKPKMLLGNIPDVYRANNRLDAYNSFHKNWGEVVQFFWLWRHQLSISSYQMARQILVTNQRNYEKYRPNSVLQRLFGTSILTSEGKNWKRQRLLMNEVFSKKRIKGFHNTFLSYSEKLVCKWNQAIQQSEGSIRLNIHLDFSALFLDIIGKTALGKDFAALDGEVNTFLEALKYIEHQSTQPLHQFAKWWKHIPLPSNRKLKQAFSTVDTFLHQILHQRQEIAETSLPDRLEANILDLLLGAPDSLDTDLEPLIEKEIRDNLLAIIVNGHETVATTVAFCLQLLAQHPEKMARAQAEVDWLMGQDNGTLTEESVSQLPYLNSVVLEVLRFAPAVAGLQRIGKEGDRLGNWSTPPQQVVGISLEPLHRDANYFGELPEQFHPERYLDSEASVHDAGTSEATNLSTYSKCPFSKLSTLLREGIDTHSRRTTMSIQKPLTFGDGARKCLGEHFAMYEMKVVLAMLLYHFDFQVAPDFKAELELGKFGLFLSAFPKYGVEMVITARSH